MSGNSDEDYAANVEVVRSLDPELDWTIKLCARQIPIPESFSSPSITKRVSLFLFTALFTRLAPHRERQRPQSALRDVAEDTGLLCLCEHPPPRRQRKVPPGATRHEHRHGHSPAS